MFLLVVQPPQGREVSGIYDAREAAWRLRAADDLGARVRLEPIKEIFPCL